MRWNISKWILMLGLAAAPAAFAQTTPSQDIHRAGSETTDAAKDTGSAVKKTSKKTAHRVKKTSKKVVHKGASATERGADKVKDKTSQ